MLIHEILTESVTTTESAISQLIQNTNSLAVLYAGPLRHQIEKLYAEGEHEDMKRTAKFVVGRTKAKWFMDNYLSTSRHTSSTQGLKNALLTVAKDPKYKSIKSELLNLGSLQVNADRQQRLELEISYSSHVSQLEGLEMILNKMSTIDLLDKGRLQQAATRLKNSVTGFYNKWSELHQKWDSDWGAGPETRAADAKKEAQRQKEKDVKRTTGSQMSQADQIISQVLSGLDKKVAHEIRQILARSDNKLQTLQRELTNRGLS